MSLARPGFRATAVCALLLLFLTTGLQAQANAPRDVTDPGPATPHLRILSYNIHHGAGNETCATPPANGDCGLDLRRIGDIIRDSGADIVGLQEVDRFWKRSGLADQPKELADMLGMFPCFGANLKLGPEAGSSQSREYGTLLLSRYPLKGCTNAPLPRAESRNEQRGLLSAQVQTPRGLLRVMVTHLSIVTADRALQAQAIVRALKASVLPTVLMGDMNAQPAEPGFQPLLRQMTDAWTIPGVQTSGAPSGFTFPCHPQRPPDRRIDYVLLSAGLAAASVEVPENAAVRMASDHYPVLVRVNSHLLGHSPGLR
jgi:endonuclease/exonuclease/phosphatase family metal-dependent hydrolase